MTDSRDEDEGPTSSPRGTGGDDGESSADRDAPERAEREADVPSEDAEVPSEEAHGHSGPTTADEPTVVAPDRPNAGAKPSSSKVSEDANTVPSPGEAPIRWFLNTENGTVLLFKDVASSLAIVAAIGLVLFAISGVWPPLVAIESGSMEPHMQKGDLVFLMENERLPSSEAAAAGVVTHEDGQETGYTKFGDYGDVIIFERDGGAGTPIIHRAHLYVEEDENWYDRADQEYIRAENCDELRQCPAPHDGFVTKGDNQQTNRYYDQTDRYEIVKPEWVRGTARVRVPYLGCIRLEFSGTASCRPSA